VRANGLQSLYVNAILAVPFAWVDLKGPYRNVRVLHQDNLVSTLESWPTRLTDQQVGAYVKVIETLATTALDLQRAGVRSDSHQIPEGNNAVPR
jgi:hypothetical protein